MQGGLNCLHDKRMKIVLTDRYKQSIFIPTGQNNLEFLLTYRRIL